MKNKTLCFQITNKCTRSCPFCISNSSPKNNLGDINNQLKIVTRLIEIGVEKISISGGEPFLLPNLSQIINLIQLKGIKSQITTNCDFFIKKGIPKWIYENRTPVILSIYGGINEHNNIMKKNHFQNIFYIAKKIPRDLISLNVILTEESLNFIKDNSELIFNIFSRLLLIEEVNSKTENIFFDIDSISALFKIENFKKKTHFQLLYHDYRINEAFPVIDHLGSIILTSNKGSQKLGSIFENQLIYKNINYSIDSFFDAIWKSQYEDNTLIRITYE